MALPLTEPAANALLSDFGDRLSGGRLVISDGAPFGTVLAVLVLGLPAFDPPIDGRMQAAGLPTVQITASGVARSAELITIEGIVVSTLRVAAADDPNAGPDALLVERTDFQRGGLCTIARLILTVPVRA